VRRPSQPSKGPTEEASKRTLLKPPFNPPCTPHRRAPTPVHPTRPQESDPIVSGISPLPYSRKPGLFGPDMSTFAKGVSKGVHNIAWPFFNPLAHPLKRHHRRGPTPEHPTRPQKSDPIVSSISPLPYSRKPGLFGPNVSIFAKGVSRGVHNIAFLLSPDRFRAFDLYFASVVQEMHKHKLQII
jgi:hypothetical protein